MQRVAQDWLVLELSHGSGAALGIATGLQFLPLLLFSLWGGAIADRYSKRRILMATQAAMGGLALILGLLALTGLVEIWQVYALAFALGLVSVVDNPTRQTFAVEMVGRADMPNAIALNSAIFNLARIVGPAVAGLVISAVGTPLAFIVNAASYGAVLIGLKLDAPVRATPSGSHAEGEGPGARGPRVRESTSQPVDADATDLLRGDVRDELPGDDRPDVARGISHRARCVRHSIGGVRPGGARRCPARRPQAPAGAGLLVVTAVVFGVLEMTTALMPEFWSFLVLLVPTGLALLTFSTAANAGTQLGTTPEMRGRVMGLYLLVFLGGTPLGAPLVGWVAEQFGPRMSLFAGGAISAVVAVVVGAMLVHGRHVRVRDYLRPRLLARLVA